MFNRTATNFKNGLSGGAVETISEKDFRCGGRVSEMDFRHSGRVRRKYAGGRKLEGSSLKC